MLDSIVQFTDARGYHYDAISKSWKDLFQNIPCSKRVEIPFVYATRWIDTTINGHDVTLQAWKGNVPHPLRGLPGGIGGEVGIYKRDQTRKIPHDLPIPDLQAFPPLLRPMLKQVAQTTIRLAIETVEAGVPHWWPYTQTGATLEMALYHPTNGDLLFQAPQEQAGEYWMSQWMTYSSFTRYAWNEGLLHGSLHPEHYVMKFTVGDKSFVWGDPHSDIEEV